MANGKSAKQYAEAIRESRGFISVAAKRLGCSRSSVYNAIAKYPTVKEAVKDARESMTDLAEGKLAGLINDSNPTAIIFYLKTQGKERGYVERKEYEHSGKDGGPIETKDINDDERLDRIESILNRARAKRDRATDE